jgi:hypothetical protein
MRSRGGIGSFSGYIYLSSVSPPTITLTSPANGATGLERPVPLAWSAQNATNYRGVVSTNSNFSGFTNNGGTSSCDSTCATWTQTATSGSFTSGQPDTAYYWRVRDNNAQTSATSEWTPTRSFSTVASTPTLSALGHTETTRTVRRRFRSPVPAA